VERKTGVLPFQPYRVGVEMKFVIQSFLIMGILISAVLPHEKITIPIKEQRNRTMISVQVGDLTIPEILLDTGFSFDGLMIYNPDYNDSLNFPDAIKVKVPGAGGGEPSIALMVDSAEFYLGSVKMTNQRLLILQSDTYAGFPSNGVIGYSIFGHYITEFNYDHKTITLHDSGSLEVDADWTTIPLYFKKNNIPWMDVSVVINHEDPILLSSYIDFAAGENIELLEKKDMKFELPKEMVEKHLGRGLSGDIYGKVGQISKLIIGPYELNNIEAAIAPAGIRSKQENADAVIGNGSLRNFNLIFDYSNRKLYLKPNKHFK
jgi:hypothetical protein